MSPKPPALPQQILAFEGSRLIGRGDPPDVALAMKRAVDRGGREPLLAFDGRTSQPVEFDLRGSDEEVLQRIAERVDSGAGGGAMEAPVKERRGPGRPKLGVISREVTLLPRHWDWLAQQPGGASANLRKLVERARRADGGRTSVRKAQESAYRFLSAMAGNEAGFEEATRALFAGDSSRFDALIEAWPRDVREHARHLAGVAFKAAAEQGGAPPCRT